MKPMKPRPADLTPAQLDDVRSKLARGEPPEAIVLTRTKAARKGAKLGEMNGLETAWSQVLEAQKQSGVIAYWYYESQRLRITFKDKPAWIKPDFFVVYADGSVTFFETKGFWREAARLRIKVAADVHRWARFIGVKRIKGEWHFENF